MNNNFGGQTMSTPSQGQLINVVLVPDIDDIDWYPINPGGSVLFLNTAMTGFRLRSREQNGFPGPERRWEVKEVTPPPQTNGAVTRKEFDEMSSKMDEMMKILKDFAK